MSELAEIFIGETREHLDILNDSLLALEKNPDNMELINEVFRVVHTMKGSSAMMGLMKMENMAHGMEDVLHDVRDGKLKVDGKLAELLFVCHDFLLNCLESVIQSGEEGDFKSDQIMMRLHAIIQANQQPLDADPSTTAKGLSLDPAALRQANELVAQGYSVYRVTVKFQADTQLKSVRALIVYQSLEGIGVLLKAVPAVSDVKEGVLTYEPDQLLLFLATEQEEAAIHQVLAVETESETAVESMGTLVEQQPSASPIRLVAAQEQPGVAYTDYTDPAGVERMVSEIIDGPAALENVIEIDREFRSDFLAEIEGYLNNIELGLIELEGAPDRSETYYRLFRWFHTIAGLAGFINFGSLKKVADQTKKFLNKIRKADSNDDHEVRKLLAISNELLKDLLNGPSSVDTGIQSRVEQHLGVLDQYQTGDLSVTDGISAPEQQIKDKSTAVGAGYDGGLKEPTADALDRQPEPLAQKASPAESPEEHRPNQNPEVIKPNGFRGVAGTEFARIPTYKIDGLVDKIGELLILHSQIEQSALQRFNANDELVNKVLRMERLIKDLQGQSMSMRMVSLKATFQKINRVARDTINELEKDVHYSAVGEDTEIDRGVAEKIQDPLLHMVKNSISHGIETAAERLQLGKQPRGEVKIQAYSKKGNVYIEVSDDGRGLSLETILKKAIEKGLADPARNYREEEIISFIFLPGFSTAEKVNHISGRGVGLDVVKTEMARIGGKIEVRNFPSRGCTFILKIPINFAALNGIIAEIFGYRCVIPTLNVKQIIQPRPEQWIFVKGKRAFFKVRDEVLPVVPIAKTFGVSEPEIMPENSLVVILELDKHQKALPVTGISGRKEVVVKPLDQEFKDQKFTSGVSILGDGRLAMILDVENLLKTEI